MTAAVRYNRIQASHIRKFLESSREQRTWCDPDTWGDCDRYNCYRCAIAYEPAVDDG